MCGLPLILQQTHDSLVSLRALLFGVPNPHFHLCCVVDLCAQCVLMHQAIFTCILHPTNASPLRVSTDVAQTTEQCTSNAGQYRLGVHFKCMFRFFVLFLSSFSRCVRGLWSLLVRCCILIKEPLSDSGRLSLGFDVLCGAVGLHIYSSRASVDRRKKIGT